MLSNKNLPFYDMVINIASRLGTLTFLKEFHNAIYTYPRQDINNLSLPALLVYPSYISTKQAGFFWEGMITIEIVRNKSTQNRGMIYGFHQQYTERIIQAICLDNEFYFRSLTRGRDYITRFGYSFSTFYDEERGTTKIDILAEIYYPAYKEWAETNGFNFENKDLPIHLTKDGFSADVTLKQEPPEPEPSMIGQNSLTPTQTGVDISATDNILRVYAEQLAIQSNNAGDKYIQATHQPISINGQIVIFDQNTGSQKDELLRPTIDSLAKIFLRNQSLVDGDICWISYNF
jgi:hypothetical protein